MIQKKLIKTEVSTSMQEINKYFVLNTNNSNYSDFVFTETNVLTEGLIIKDADDIYDEDSEDIKNLYKVSTGICKLSENIDKWLYFYCEGKLQITSLSHSSY